MDEFDNEEDSDFGAILRGDREEELLEYVPDIEEEEIQVQQEEINEEEDSDFGAILRSGTDYSQLDKTRQVAFGWGAEPLLLSLNPDQNFGMIGQAATAVATTLFTDQTIEDKYKELEQERVDLNLKSFPRFEGLAVEDETGYITTGRVAAGVFDPVGFVVPWTKVATLGKTATVLTGAALGASETAAREYTINGEVSRTALGIGAIGGGVAAGIGEVVKSVITKRAATKAEGITEVEPAVVKSPVAQGIIDDLEELVSPSTPSANQPSIDDMKIELMGEASQRLSRGERKQLLREQEELRAKLNAVVVDPAVPVKQKDVPARAAKKQAQGVAREAAEEERRVFQDPLDIIDRRLEADELAGNAQSDLSRLEQGIIPLRYKVKKEPIINLTKQEIVDVEISAAKVTEKADDIKPEDLVNYSFIKRETDLLEAAKVELQKLQKNSKRKKKADPAADAKLKKQLKVVQDAEKRLVQNTVKLSQQRTNSSVDIVEDLASEGKLTDSIMQKIIYEVARPIGFGLGGSAIGLSTMEEDDGFEHVLMYATAGAALGQFQKKIQRSSAFTSIDKETGQSFINNAGAGFLGNIIPYLKYNTGASTAARMDAMGGWNKVIGNRLFSTLGSNVESVESRTQRLQAEYLEKLMKITGSPAERSWATRGRRMVDLSYDVIDDKNVAMNTIAGEIMRGYTKVDDIAAGYTGLNKNLRAVDADDVTEIKAMVPQLEKLRDETANRMREVGINFKEIDSYGLQQVWDIDAADINYNQFVADLEEAITIQAKNRMSSAGKASKSVDPKVIKERARKMADKITGRFIEPSDSSFFGAVESPIFSRNKDTQQYKFRTAAKAFEKQRLLSDVEATKFMYEKGYLNLHAGESLSSYGTESIKVAEFAEAFGANGEIINLALQKTRESFVKAIAENPNNTKYLKKRQEAFELQMTGSIEAYWGGYGKRLQTEFDLPIKAFTTLANTRFLTTVSIANLGDMVQPFTNSSYGAAMKTLAKRISSKGDKQFAQMGSFKYDDGYARDLSSMMRKSGSRNKATRALENINDFYFFTVGLSKVTKMSRNFAHDVGVNRAFDLAKKTKLSKKNLAELSEMKLTTDELKAIGRFDTVEEAFEADGSRQLLEKAGRSSSDRDAIIPSVGNRLLFTNTNNNAIRAVGQFMSWAQAKTSQTNRLLTRVENGDAKLAIKILAATPVYAGFLELKRTLNPNYIPDDDDVTDVSAYNFAGDAMKLGGGFNNAILDKVLGTLKSMSYNKGAAEAAVPSFDLLFKTGRGIVETGEDLAEGNVERALKRLALAVPGVAQASGWTEKITDDPLIDMEKDKSSGKIRRFNKGGEVLNVPNVPVEPDQRIDKMTGLPYNQQAGTAFVDKEDRQDPLQRLGFVKGGMIEDPLKRLGFGEGGKASNDMKRIDGTTKSARGYLGPIKSNVTGGTMTEVSIGGEQGEPLIPVLVPTLTKEEVKQLSNTDFEGNAKAIPRSIIRKALAHAEKRRDAGLNAFYQDGE